MSRSALYGRAPPVRSRRHVRIRRGFGPCLQPRTAGALPWQRPRDREPWVWIACVRPFTPSVIKSGLVVSRDTETEGSHADVGYVSQTNHAANESERDLCIKPVLREEHP